MSEDRWICELNDGYQLFVFRALGYRDPIPGDGTHPSELAALEYGLACLEQRRECLADAIKDARRRIRKAKQSNPTTEGEGE